MTKDDSISVWFFIGVLVAFYGIVILAYGVSVLGAPLPDRALSHLHPDVWWGGLMTAIGGVYCVKFYPKKRS